MDVATNINALGRAEIMEFHPAKNIPITGGYSTLGIIKDFSKVNITEKMEIDHKDFKNGGHGVQFWAKSHALTFYDKNKDLEKSESKAYGSDQTSAWLGSKRRAASYCSRAASNSPAS